MYSCTHGAQINFGDLTPYLTYVVSEGGRLSKYVVLVIVKIMGFGKHDSNGRVVRLLLFRKAMVTLRVLDNGFWRVRVGSGGYGGVLGH